LPVIVLSQAIARAHPDRAPDPPAARSSPAAGQAP
jgi:hypothetical protein